MENEFFSQVCKGLGLDPTPARLEMLKAWHRREGMPLEKTWNPLATTWYFDNHPRLNGSFDIGYGPGNWNSVPVRVYASLEDGVEATVLTLKQDNYYHHILRCLVDETGYEQAVSEMATYVGNYAYGTELIDEWKRIGEEYSTVDKATLEYILNSIRQLQDVVAGGPEGVQAVWDDQGQIIKGLGDVQKALHAAGMWPPKDD